MIEARKESGTGGGGTEKEMVTMKSTFVCSIGTGHRQKMMQNGSWRNTTGSKLHHIFTICCIIVVYLCDIVTAFSSCLNVHLPKRQAASTLSSKLMMTTNANNNVEEETQGYPTTKASSTRREILLQTAGMAMATSLLSPTLASAEVGTLPEFAETNAILQGITVNVADASQQQTMIAFLDNAFDFKVLRKRIRGTVEETWMGFGPEQLSIPDTFQLPVSSFGEYGGHASICVRYDSSLTAPLYRQGDDAPGDNIAYLQLGVPGYRISQMVANGGKILDAYGLVNVVSPAGLPIRGIVGISPDPIMLVAVNCKDVQASKAFYQQLGFVETDVPYSRPSMGTTIFEPAPPKGSVYMSPSKNCMGVLLLTNPNKRKAITTNPVVECLNLVYKPTATTTATTTDDGTTTSGGDDLVLTDPSNVAIKFQSVSDFTALEKSTR